MNLLDFFKSAPTSQTQTAKSGAIAALRDVLNNPNVLANLEYADEKAEDHVKNRLLKEEINLFRTFGVPGSSFMSSNQNKVQLALLTKNVSRLVCEIIIKRGGSIKATLTGMLIAILDEVSYKWAILSCGHLIDEIGCDKDEGVDDTLLFKHVTPAGITINLPIKQIKVFKRPNQSFSMALSQNLGNFVKVN